jgi:hypothetical protein
MLALLAFGHTTMANGQGAPKDQPLAKSQTPGEKTSEHASQVQPRATSPTPGATAGGEAAGRDVGVDEYGVHWSIRPLAACFAIAGFFVCVVVAFMYPHCYKIKAIFLGLWTIGIPFFYLLEWSLTKFTRTDGPQCKL